MRLSFAERGTWVLGGLLGAAIAVLVAWLALVLLSGENGAVTGPLRVVTGLFALLLVLVAIAAWALVVRSRPLEDRRIRLLLELPVGGLVLVEADGRVRFANDAAGHFFGRSPAALEGVRLPELFVPESRARLTALLERGTPGTTSEPLSTGALRPDGSRAPVELVVRWGRGAPAGLAGVHLRDLREQQALVEALTLRGAELARSNRELEQFSYIASHDLQEPLRMVGSYTQLLQSRYGDRLDSDAREFLAFAQEGATRMRELIDDLLAYSRVGTRAEPFARVPMQGVFDLAMFNLKAALEDARAVVTHDPLPEVRGDQRQLAQVLQNLLGNAIKFRGPHPPHVHVGVRRDGPDWVFSVSDDGIGIPREYQDRIFVIFQRLHSRAEYPGTGIGLSICRKVVERHGGRIWVESSGIPGEGTTFRFTLPAEPRSAVPAPAPAAAPTIAAVRAQNLIEDRLRDLV